ncbi:quinol:cytochrome c oxidoreductase quinone-binding subunit 2 [Lishizhenia tianjinensis]|uniref:Quinol:cytochrome c oxidoreductase quinone-binding subunit 2 n=1 Tax=Lishizhenia tianjinensis TaxID=477690 RepID=A0A1I7B484_9FLAO|nr:quinol:cytochrome C oxidoreductase [Lishizhenia tianjinensis]SFT81997.1 quinol:cytochrome c oxidoreductase quinone-binding subunit 2 [Lishizhenia tianjinensis]
MEFQVSNKAKMLTTVLMAVGIVFTLVGVVMAMGDHQLGTKIYSNMLVNSFFFFGIGLGALFFLALQYATETGWYAVIKRVIEAVAGFLPFGIGMMLVTLLTLSFTHGGHVYMWMDPDTVAHDSLVSGKSAYLNQAFFWIRTIAYMAIYFIFWRGFKNRSIQQDQNADMAIDLHFKNYRKGAAFLVFFAYFSSTSSWDWIMSIDTHWFSTLFGWYTFAGTWCSTMIVLVTLTLYLKKKGYLPKVNESHIHDLGKWTFATSFLWSYLWFSQFMLIWYANIPEEVTYYLTRRDNFTFLYFGMFFINFAFPMLILMSRDAKRHAGILTFVGLIIFAGHWLDVWVMVMPGTIGPKASVGLLDLGMAVLCLGFFVRVVLTNLTKAPLVAVNHPFLDESLHHDI